MALYPAVGGGSRRLNLLVRGGTQLVRSRSGARAIAALLAYLSADTSAPDDTLAPVNASAAVQGDTALLLPAGLVNWTKQIQTTASSPPTATPRTPGWRLARLFEDVAAQGVWLDRPSSLDEQLDAS